MTRILRLCLFLFVSLFLSGTGHADTVSLQPGHGIADLKPHLTYTSDPKASLGEILKRFRDGQFGPDMEASLLATNYAPEAWAAVEIFNATIDDGRDPDPFVLTIDLPLVSEVDAYVVRKSGLTENLIDYSIFEPFVPEAHSVTRLRTPVFTIAPQERVTLLVNFKFGPFQSFNIALETPVELEASAFAAGIGETAFYAFTISCLIFFLGFHLAMKNWIGLLYAIQFAVGLGILAYIDGLWFRFFFPDNPDLQSPVGFFLLFSLSANGFLISAQSLVRDGKRSTLSKVLAALAVLPVVGFALSFYSPGTYTAFFGYVLLALMFVAVFVTSMDWRKHEGPIHLTGVLISALGMVLIIAMIAAIVIGSRAELIPAAIAVKGIFSILMVSTMTGLTAHIINLRRNHAKAVEAELVALEAEATRSRELLVAERNYTRARELASLRQRQLATASHDLKQPIMSLRMNFDSLSEHVAPDVRQRLKEAFDYMEALSNDYLRETAPEQPEDGQEEASGIEETPAEEQEVYEVSLVLDTVHQMFNEEAISKGLRLRRVPSSKTIAVPPLILMRIVSNLVSNAIKYTEKGSVLIGVRDRGKTIDLCVLDTGTGMDADEIEAFSHAYNKGETSTGNGLGLSVCYELSKDNGMDLTCHSEKGKGTSFTLTIPRAA